MKIEPLGARVLIEPAEDEQTFAGGQLVLPGAARGRPQQGIVRAIGDPEEMLTDLEVGDRVIFPQDVGAEVQVAGVDYLLMEEADVLARIRE
jgi:chaperonin GroES